MSSVDHDQYFKLTGTSVDALSVSGGDHHNKLYTSTEKKKKLVPKILTATNALSAITALTKNINKE